MNRRPTILVVEDAPNIRRFMRRVLEDQPYDVVEAASGEEAVAILDDQKQTIDVVLLDLLLPGIDGIQVLGAIRANRHREGVKVIVLTAVTDVEDRVRAFSAGANEYVTKPASREELLARIEVQARLKLAETEVREGEDRYRDLFENANDLIQSVAPDGSFVFVNRAWRETLGYSEDDVPTLSVLDVVHPSSRDNYTRVFTRVLAGEQPGIVEAKFVSRDGTVVDVEGKVNCSFRGGSPVAARWIFRDVTERKKAEHTIRSQAAALGERLKELHCLYAVSRLAEKPAITVEELVQAMLTLIPYAWRYADVTCARAIVEDREFRAADFEETAWRQQADIGVDGEVVGMLEVCYVEEKPTEDEGPFIAEERELIDALAEELGRFIARRRAEDEIRQLNEDLEQRVVERTAELQEANEQLREEIVERQRAEKLFENLANAAPIGIYGVFDGNIHFANPQFEEYVGYTFDELRDREALGLVFEEDRERVRETATRMLGEGSTAPYEYGLVTKNGNVVPVMESVASIWYMGKRMTLGYLMEISDRKEAERKIEEQYRDIEVRSQELEMANLELLQTQTRLIEANEKLQESEKKYRVVVEQANDWICIVQDGALKYVNPHSIEIIGHRPEQMMETPFADCIHPDEMLAWVAREENRRAAGDIPSRYETTLLHANGARIEVEINAGRIPYKGRDAELVVIRDITERKQTERERERLLAALRVQNDVAIAANLRLGEALEQVEKAQEDLKASQAQLLQSEKLAAVGQLISGVAHELNNPLQAVSGYAELMLMYVEDEMVRQDLDNLLDDTKRAIAIVRNLLSFARKEEGQRKCISVNDAIDSVIKLRTYELALDQIDVEADLDRGIPGTMADYQQLQQVFLNLLINAEQAMKESGRRGRVIVRTEQLGPVIRVTVSDDGPGISADIIARVFEPFFTTKEIGHGTGLGLSICYGIINEHGGSIEVMSDEGEGATFVIELPVVAKTVEVST